MINIIADIAGRFDELMLLLAKMPKTDMTICLGDLPDRGTQTKQVIEYIMNTPGMEAIKGNHDQMMVDGYNKGDLDMWFYNGASPTLDSYGGDINLIPKEHIDWLNSRPLYFDLPDVFLSHAPVTSLSPTHLPKRFSQDFRDIGRQDGAFIWNRYAPSKPLGKFHIHGHNSKYREYKFGDGTIYGICLDNSMNGELRGIHWNGPNNYQIYTQEYLDAKET